MQTKYYPYLLFFLSVLFFFPFLGHVHLFDWDEINFAESAREMIVTGDYYRVRINFDPFWEKPPFFFWLQVISMKIFGINEFAARFPNAVFGVITILTIYSIGKKLYNNTYGFIWGLLYLGSFLPHLYFKSGIIDPIFNFFIFLGIYFLANVLDKKTNQPTYALLAGTFIGLAIITKGPVGLLLLLLTFLVYVLYNKFKVNVRITDVLAFTFSSFLVTGIWFGYEVYQNGPWFIFEFIKYQIELFSQPVAGHEQPFYYHFIVVLIGCFPLSILAIGGFKKPISSTPLDFLKWMKILFWVVLILFSIVKTKIVHYSSMTYLPLSYIAAFYMYHTIINKEKVHRFIQFGILFFGAIFSLLLVALPILFYNKNVLIPLIKDPFVVDSLQIDMGWTGWEVLCGLLYPIGVFTAFIFLKKRKELSFLITLTCFAGFTLLLYAIFIIPKVEQFSQGPAIEFLKSIEGKDVYIATYSHKSYAPYFYSKTKPCKESDGISTIKRKYIESLEHKTDFNGTDLNTITKNWLLEGKIDKPTYFVSKSTTAEEMKRYEDIEFLYHKGGFNFYKRNPTP